MQQGAGAAAGAARSTSADEMVEELVHRPMSPAVRIVFTLLILLNLNLVLNQQFNLHLFGITMIDTRSLFLMAVATLPLVFRSEEHTSELQSLMRIPYYAFSSKKNK